MSYKHKVNLAGLLALLIIPLAAYVLHLPFLVTLFTKFAIYAIAAVSLDLLLGYGGLVCFGHAMFFGLGGYVISIMGFHLADGLPLLGGLSNNALILSWIRDFKRKEAHPQGTEFSL